VLCGVKRFTVQDSPDSRCACNKRPLLLTPTQFYVWR